MTNAERNNNVIHTTFENFDLDLNGRPVNVQFTRTTERDYDPNYGADADGNRGIGAWSIERDDVTEIGIEDDGTFCTISLVLEQERDIINTAIAAYIDENEQNCPAEGPDYDDRFDTREERDDYDR